MRKQTLLIVIGIISGSVLVGLILGRILGIMIFGSGITSKEHRHQDAQTLSTHTLKSPPAIHDYRKKKNTITKLKPSVNFSTATPFSKSHPHNSDDDLLSEINKESLGEESSGVNKHKSCLTRMHAQGWYKPEDVPIIYEEPDGKSDGVYICKEFIGTENPLNEPPEYIKKRNREIIEERERAFERKDYEEVSRLTRKWQELNKPYISFTVSEMHTVNIPESWEPYFRKIFLRYIRDSR